MVRRLKSGSAIGLKEGNGCGADGVLALLCALDVAILAVALVEEIPLSPLVARPFRGE